MISHYSVENYEIAKPAVLEGVWTGSGSDEELAKLDDGINTVDY
jgi:hypothetical protein